MCAHHMARQGMPVLLSRVCQASGVILARLWSSRALSGVRERTVHGRGDDLRSEDAGRQGRLGWRRVARTARRSSGLHRDAPASALVQADAASPRAGTRFHGRRVRSAGRGCAPLARCLGRADEHGAARPCGARLGGVVEGVAGGGEGIGARGCLVSSVGYCRVLVLWEALTDAWWGWQAVLKLHCTGANARPFAAGLGLLCGMPICVLTAACA